MISFVPASVRHIGPIARNMREMDRIECEALGHGPKDALRSCLKRSLWTLTAMKGDVPHAMFGVAPVSAVEGIGIPFFLGTDTVYRHGRDLLSRGPAVIEHMRQSFPILENVVAAENDRAIRLLKHWGFTLGEGLEVGGVPFIRFGMGRETSDL